MPITSANIDIGSLPNDGSGDPLRVAFEKINNNFDELALLTPGGPTGAIQFKDANALPAGTANFVYDSSNNIVNIGADFIPTSDANVDIGASAFRIGNLWLANTALKLGNISINESGNTISFPVTVFPNTKASLEVNDLTVLGQLNLENEEFGSFDIITTTNTANQVIFESPLSSFNTGSFKIVSREAGTNNSQSVQIELTKSNDNTYVKMAAFATTFEVLTSDTWVTKYNADVGFGNVRLMVSPARNSTITHTVSYQVEVA